MPLSLAIDDNEFDTGGGGGGGGGPAAAVEAAVAAVAAVAARRQRRPATVAGEGVAGAFDCSGSVAAFNGGNGQRQGDGKRECN